MVFHVWFLFLHIKSSKSINRAARPAVSLPLLPPAPRVPLPGPGGAAALVPSLRRLPKAPVPLPPECCAGHLGGEGCTAPQPSAYCPRKDIAQFFPQFERF